jgi:hypothetical protein
VERLAGDDLLAHLLAPAAILDGLQLDAAAELLLPEVHGRP